MDSEKDRPSCRDQFNRSNPQPKGDDWVETFIARLRALLDRMNGKK